MPPLQHYLDTVEFVEVSGANDIAARDIDRYDTIRARTRMKKRRKIIKVISLAAAFGYVAKIDSCECVQGPETTAQPTNNDNLSSKRKPN